MSQLDYPSYRRATFELQSTGYIGAFDPDQYRDQLRQTDAGLRASPRYNYSFTVPANTSVTITVNEATAQCGQ